MPKAKPGKFKEPTQRQLDAVAWPNLTAAERKRRRAATVKWTRGPADELAVAQGCFFDEAAADRVCEFFEEYLTHSKGRWAGKPFKLQEWQEFEVLRPLFGWMAPYDAQAYLAKPEYDEEGDLIPHRSLRRYRVAYIEIPKKNGKSELMAGITLYMFAADGEPGAEVYTIAEEKEQAGIVFKAAEAMVAGCEELEEKLKVVPSTKRILKRESDWSERVTPSDLYRVFSSDYKSKHGFNIHCLGFDELHTQINRELFDALADGDISREQSLLVSITTSGTDRNSICYEQRTYAQKVISGAVDDYTFFGLIYGADEDDDWTDPKIWKKANPSYGVTMTETDFRNKFKKAKETPAKQAAFKRLRLGIWTSASNPFFDLDDWQKCNEAIVREALFGRDCYAALDLAAVNDLSALDLVFPPLESGEPYIVLNWIWLPEKNIDKKAILHNAPYRAWQDMGLLELTPGPTTDFKFIIKRLNELAGQFNIQEAVFDSWGAQSTINDLAEAGFKVIEFQQTVKNFSAPMKFVGKLVTEGAAKKEREAEGEAWEPAPYLTHGGDPVLAFSAANTVAYEDVNGNVRPDKSKSTNKIDPTVALIMAMSRAMAHVEDQGSMTLREGIMWLDD